MLGNSPRPETTAPENPPASAYWVLGIHQHIKATLSYFVCLFLQLPMDQGYLWDISKVKDFFHLCCFDRILNY